MKQKKVNRVALLLHWAGEQKIWLFLAIFLSAVSGLCIIVPYIGIYRLMDATFNHTCTQGLVVQTVAMIAVAVTLQFALFGCSGVAAHKGAYGALFKVRCMVAEHMARAPLGALNERRTGDIKTVLNEDIEKLELFLAHNLPDLVCYLVGPVIIFIYLMTVNIPLALISLVPLILAVVVMGMMFCNTDDLMERANRSIITLNSVMIEFISGMKLIKAYNMGSKSFQKFSDAIQEENAMWNETSRRMGPPYAAFVVIIECGMLLMVPIGGMFFLKGSLAASAFLLFVYVGSMYLTEIRPLQELGTNFANVLNAVTKTKEILDIPIYEGGTDFPQNHDIELRNVWFSYKVNGSEGDREGGLGRDDKTDVLQGVNLKIKDGERMALVGQSGAGKSTVIELISRFYDVQEGEVLIGGKNVKGLNYDTILKNVAIVFQKTFLTRDSVLENIRMGSGATLEEVRTAAKEAQIDDFIMSLPDGYDTKVGSFGSRFSGGEKQRIAIARAILKNAPILILDEATSASDPENQMEIDKAIQNLCKGKTVIVVAHRLSALKMCERVAVVENHTITCVGTHEEVRKNNAYYRKAWKDYETARNITYQLEGGEQHE
ncbi:MAG: ABC transporter ATP-binding protein [[Clostridium] symbiosum]